MGAQARQQLKEMVWARASENMVLEAIARLAGLHDALEQLLRGSCQEAANAGQSAPAQAAAAGAQEPPEQRQPPLDDAQRGMHAAPSVPLPLCSDAGDPSGWGQHDDVGAIDDASLLATPPPPGGAHILEQLLEGCNW